MTTIASDGRTVAADGMETWGSEAVALDRKKIVRLGDVLYALTGVGAMLGPCMKWYNDGAVPDKAPEVKGDGNSWALCVFTPEHVKYFTNTVPYEVDYPYPFSVGSGCDYATGAMLAGASPRRAVEIAASRNLHTGGLITELEIPRAATAMAQAAE